MNLYEITYYSYDSEYDCYCVEFSRLIKLNKSSNEIDSLIESWNCMLLNKNIKGRISYREIEIESEYTFDDLINDIQEL